LTTYHQYTTKQKEFVRELYTKEEYTLKLLTVEFNRQFKTQLTEQRIKAALSRWRFKSLRKGGCRKGQVHSGSFSLGNELGKKSTTHFQKGNIPWNKKIKE
jgi:hypothetical protein